MANNKIKALAASVANMETIGESKGNADKALWSGCKAFSEDFNSGLFDGVSIDDKAAMDKLTAEYAGHFARGQQRKSGEVVSDTSKGTYASKFKLFASPAVHKVIDSLETQTTAFCKAVAFKDRAEKNFWTLASAAASKVSKSKVPLKISREIFSEIVADSVKRSEARKTPTILTPAQAQAAALESFRLACIDMQVQGLATKAILAALKPVAVALAIDIATPKKAK